MMEDWDLREGAAQSPERSEDLQPFDFAQDRLVAGPAFAKASAGSAPL